MAESTGSGAWEYAQNTVKLSWHVLKTKFQMLWPLALLSFVPSAIGSLLQKPIDENDLTARLERANDGNLENFVQTVFGVSIGELVFTAFLIIAVLVIYNVFVQGAGIRSILDLLKKPETKIDFSSIMAAGKQHFAKVFVAGIAVGIVVFIGFVLLIIPGIIAAILLSFTFHAVIDKGLGPRDAMKMSYEMVKDNLSKFLLLGFIYFLIAIVAAIILAIVNAILPLRLELLVQDAYSAVFSLMVLIGGTKFYLDQRQRPNLHQSEENN